MKNKTILRLKSFFGSKSKGKRRQKSRSPSPESGDSASPQYAASPVRVGPPPSPPVPTHPVAPTAPEPAGPIQLTPCPVCARTFVPQSLAKHVKICEKTSAKKRKMFDSFRQRREGTDLAQFLPKNFGLPDNSPFLEKSPPNTAKVVPKPKPHTVKSAIKKPSAELERCPHCQRRFGPRAFERHVEWCADKARILPAAPSHQPPAHITDAKQRLNARTQYKAPPLRGRQSSKSRDKSLNSRSASVESSRAVTPPRDHADIRSGRVRASESMSSNDCHEEASPHVPVIKGSRSSVHNGEAGVKARQARLARDLSNTRNTQNSKTNQKSNNKLSKEKQLDKDISNTAKLSLKKQKQLEKLETIAQKYNEKIKSIEEAKDKLSAKVQSVLKKPTTDKSQIPVAKKEKIKSVTRESNKGNANAKVKEKEPTINNESIKCKLDSDPDISKKALQSARRTKTRQSIINSKLDKPISPEENIQTQDNTLVCPCVPYVINKKPDTKQKEKHSKLAQDSIKQKVELLYQNPTVVACDVAGENREINMRFDEDASFSLKTFNNSELPENFSDNLICIASLGNCVPDDGSSKGINLHAEHSMETNVYSTDYAFTERSTERSRTFTEINNVRSDCPLSEIHNDKDHNLLADDFDDNYVNNLSENDDDIERSIKFDDDISTEPCHEMSRHGSGDTYTKFTENPADLEEFLNVTDQMIDVINKTKIESNDAVDIKKTLLDNIHTPNTNSLESIAEKAQQNPDILIKTEYSEDTFTELKNSLKELLQNEKATSEQNLVKMISIDESTRDICNMEHITVYSFGTAANMIADNKLEPIEDMAKITESSVTKLPSIMECNKSDKKDLLSKSRIKILCKTNKKYKFSQNNETKHCAKEISDCESISADAPPLKLPRIETKRINDTYDPFLSAAKQMKELMSSESNIPKQLESTNKDRTRTLPMLRPSRDKISASYLRQENTKTMKDSINRTYQKTPTLQRMKSFGSTVNDNNTIGGRCSSFRVKNTKNTTSPLNTTFTKSSKENISTTEKNTFNRNSSMNKSFSSYSNSCYSTPKPKDKIPKISTSMYHSFQRTTTKQAPKVNAPNKPNEKVNNNEFVNLDAILTDDNTSLNDSTYIDPRLINENDNLPINVNTILNNPHMISSMESLLTTENLPAKFESFNSIPKDNINTPCKDNIDNNKECELNKINMSNVPSIDDLSSQYNKIMSSLEQSIASKASIRDDDSLCDDFDLEEFMTNFDEEINKQKLDNKRICSSTTRILKQSDLLDSNRNSNYNSSCPTPQIVHSNSNGSIAYNKSIPLNFSSNNSTSDLPFLSSFKRSTSFQDSNQKKSAPKNGVIKNRQKPDQLEHELMQSLKDFDSVYKSEQINKKPNNNTYNGKESRKPELMKLERKSKKMNDSLTNGNCHTNGTNGKSSNDSAYSSLNRISPSKLTVYNGKETNGCDGERHPIGSDTSNGTHQDNDIRSISSEEFLAMERSTELDEPIAPKEKSIHKDINLNEKRVSSRLSSRRQSPTWHQKELSSSGSESSVHRAAAAAPPPAPAPASAPLRLSRFCHECGNKFPMHTAKFCIECGVKRLLL